LPSDSSFALLLPLTALNDGLRSVITDGASIFMPPSLFVLGAWSLITFIFALHFFRWH
jgi:ABC-type polysaccharide/polyol phosphate export permease